MNGFSNVGVDAPPFLDGGNDGGEVVVRENHVGCPLGHVGARHSHGAADVRRLEGRGVIDAVSSHGHHMAPLLPRLYDAHFVLRSHPGKDGKFFDVLLRLSRSTLRGG